MLKDFPVYFDDTKLYDLKSKDYKTRTMRIRNFKSAPEKNNEKLPGTNGLYTVSFDLLEF